MNESKGGFSSCQNFIRHFRDEKGTGEEKRPAIVSGIFTGVTCAGQLLANLFPVPSNSPRRLCES